MSKVYLTNTLSRNLVSNHEIKAWISSFVEEVKITNPLSKRIVRRTNVKNFLQSLYFRLKWAENVEYCQTIAQALKQINPYVKQDG